MMTLWSSPLDQLNTNPFTPFDQRGTPARLCRVRFRPRCLRPWRCTAPCPHGHHVCRFVGVRLILTYWIRPYLLAPLRLVAGLKAPTPNSSGGLAPPQVGDETTPDEVINAGAG